MMQQPTKGTNKRTTKQTKRVTRREGMEAADDFFGLFVVGRSGYVDYHLT
jgi:hypothetical protein